VIDFTDSAKPVEIGYFDRGPVDPEHLVIGGYWSVYWYDGHIYGTEIVRGLDVLELLPSEYLSANEIAAARLADQGSLFNPQQQFRVDWPVAPAVAWAYLDQLGRDQRLGEALAAEIATALDEVEAVLARQSRDRRLAGRLRSMAASVRAEEGDAVTARRTTALAQTLAGLADRVTAGSGG